MEKALKYELETNIIELVGNVYPTNAPETSIKPYLVYTRINTKDDKTLGGYTGTGALSFMFSIMATKYGDMKSITTKVVNLIKTFIGTGIGVDNSIHVQDIEINNVSETYEPLLLVNRGIIDFTIYY